MSVLYDPTALLYAVVEYLPQSDHIYDQVDGRPQKESQYRLVCLAADSEAAWQIAHLLRALSGAVQNGHYGYTVTVAGPAVPAADETPGDDRRSQRVDIDLQDRQT